MSEHLPHTSTPPKIVAAAGDQAQALAAFIAQELEQWGFAVLRDPRDGGLVVNADGYRFSVDVARLAQ